MNVRSVRNKTLYLCDYIATTNSDFVALSETWFNSEDCIVLYCIMRPYTTIQYNTIFTIKPCLTECHKVTISMGTIRQRHIHKLITASWICHTTCEQR